MEQYNSKNGIIQYRIVRSDRRTMEISIRDGGVLVRCPKRMPLKEVQAFLDQKSGWIIRHLSEQKQRTKPEREYHEGGMFPLLGSEYPLHLGDDFAFQDGRICVDLNPPPLVQRKPIFSGGSNMSTQRLVIMALESARDAVCSFEKAPAKTDATSIRQALATFYSRFARMHIPRRVQHYMPIMGVDPSLLDVDGIKFREYKSQWGSCSAQNRLAFNIRLVLYRERVIDYVVVHELAHLLQRNHSAAFWGVVGTVLPDYARLRCELKEDIRY